MNFAHCRSLAPWMNDWIACRVLDIIWEECLHRNWKSETCSFNQCLLGSL